MEPVENKDDCGCDEQEEARVEPIEFVHITNVEKYPDVPGTLVSEQVYKYITFVSYLLLAAWVIYFIVKFAELSKGERIDG